MKPKKQPLWRRLLRRPRAPETGEANARRFAATVVELALEERVIICYPRQGLQGAKGREHGWEWMLNPLWRARVLELLQDAPVRNAEFHPPDSLDGWTFSAYSTVPVPLIAQLDLSQSL